MSDRLALRGVLVILLAVGAAWAVAGLSGDAAYLANEDAVAKLASGDARAALTALRGIQRQRPELREVDVNAALAALRMNDTQRALVDLSSASLAEDAAVRSTAFYDRGNALFGLQRFADARAAWVESLRADPTRLDAKYNIEVVDAMIDVLGPNLAGAPGGPQQPGAGPSQAPGQPGQTGPGASPQPGQGGPNDPNAAPGQRNPDATPPPSVGQAVLQFRRNLSVDDALRVLDALRAEQQGIEAYLEGSPARRTPQGPPLY